MTHEYTILLGGVVIPGGSGAAAPGTPGCSAIAWAAGTILVLGTDDEVRAISRGDSHVHQLGGAIIRPADDDGSLEVGGPADMEVLAPGTSIPVAVIRDGRVVDGVLPGDWHHEGAHERGGGGHTRA